MTEPTNGTKVRLEALEKSLTEHRKETREEFKSVWKQMESNEGKLESKINASTASIRGDIVSVRNELATARTASDGQIKEVRDKTERAPTWVVIVLSAMGTIFGAVIGGLTVALRMVT